MRIYTDEELTTNETPTFAVDFDRVGNIRQDEIDYYLDVARRMRAEAIVDLFRKVTATLAHTLHLTSASRGATPRAV